MFRRIILFLVVVLLLSFISFTVIGQALKVEHTYIGTATGIAPVLSGRATYCYVSSIACEQEVYVDGQSYYPLMMPLSPKPCLMPILKPSLKPLPKLSQADN